MQDSVYRVQWILDLDDPNRSGFFGTTNHIGTSPAAAALASACSISTAVEESWGRAHLHILKVSEEDGDQNLLSGPELMAALRRMDSPIPNIDVMYRPLC